MAVTPSSATTRTVKNWTKVVALGSGARIFALGSQFIVVLLLSWVLGRDAFGELMIVFTFYKLASMGLGSGLGSIALYHIGRHGGAAELDIRLHRTLGLVGLAVSAAIAVGCITWAPLIARLFGKPDMVVWLVNMAPFVVFSTLTTIAANSLDGRSNVTSSIVLYELVPNILRILFVSLIWGLSLPGLLIAHVMWIALAAPWLFDAVHLLRRRTRGLEPLRWWDLRYGLLFMINTLAAQQLQGIDMLVVGWLFDSDIAAGYAIVSRLAALFPFFQQILQRNFAPRAGALLHREEIETLNSELVRLRSLSLIAVSGLTGSILLVSPLVLKLFGNYSNDMALLSALSIPILIRSLFPGNDVILRMAGKAGFSLAVMITSAALLVFIPLLMSPLIGVYALPLAMLISALLLQPLMAAHLRTIGVITSEGAGLPMVVVACAFPAVSLVLSQPVAVGLVSAVGPLFISGYWALKHKRTAAGDRGL